MITVNEAKKAAIDARTNEGPRDVAAELDALKAALVEKKVISVDEIAMAASSQSQEKVAL